MSATPADDAQTSPAWYCGANIQHFFDMSKEKTKKLQNEAFFSFFGLEDVAEPLQFSV